MSTGQVETGEAALHVRNVGGIEETTVSFTPGVTILAGRNATNRTSLLQAIMAACGSDDIAIKGDADEAELELELGENTYQRTLTRQNGAIRSSGEPYLEDPTLADLFSFLLESNEARRAVTRGDDLRELIMRPVDTDAIQSEVDRLLERRRSLEAELDEIDSLKGKLPSLEEERGRLETRIEEKREELEETEAELDALDADVEESRGEKAELEGKLDELSRKRSSLEDVRYDIETERESLEALKRERSELEDEQDSLPEAPVGEMSDIDAEVDRLRERKRKLESEINDLQSIIRFNEGMLEDRDNDVLRALGDGGSTSGSVTDQLVEDGMTTCWTCGSQTETDQIEHTLDHLREVSAEKLEAVGDIQDDLDELTAERKELESKQRRHEEVERRLDRLAAELEEREDTLETLQERREELTDEIAAVETEVEDLEDDSYTEILDLHREANQLEYDLGKLEGDLDRVEENIATLESRLGEREDLEAEREDLQAEIEDLRTKIERIEQQAIEEFNTHMDALLERLGYDNLDRIWLERTETQVREGRRKVQKSVFDLHVIRKTASGTAYEDTVDHLSESERELTGLVFALAGYLAHEVHEQVPFMLLDSLEAIDSERIAQLVEYLEQYADYLVVALLPEDAAALDDDYARIETI